MCQRGLGRRRTKSCGVSDAAEQNPAGYQTLQNKILRGIRRCRTKSCGVSDAAEQNPAGYQTLQNKILQDIRCRRTKSCRVSDPTEQWHSCIHFITDVCSAGSEMFAFKIRVIKSRGTILLITCAFEYRCLAGEFF
jgi:alpha-D-ribose 1-methylphosphonate 5-triphosphate synthase subunit PhnG